MDRFVCAADICTHIPGCKWRSCTATSMISCTPDSAAFNRDAWDHSCLPVGYTTVKRHDHKPMLGGCTISAKKLGQGS